MSGKFNIFSIRCKKSSSNTINCMGNCYSGGTSMLNMKSKFIKELTCRLRTYHC